MNVPAGCVYEHPTGPLIVRVGSLDDVPAVRSLHHGRVIWVEAPLALASAAWPPEIGLDVLVTDPATEAPSLYQLTRLRDDRPLRVTLPVAAGVGRAARIAMALHLPLRLLPLQPRQEALAELHSVLDLYLHGPQTTTSVQPFDSALAYWLHGNPATAWMALDLDPAFVRRVPDRGETAGATAIPGDPDFVAARVKRLVADGAECATCPFLGWCAALFKWPDPAYRCEAVRPLLATLADSAAQIARDLAEAEGLRP